MAKRKDQFLTKVAKKTLDYIYESSDLTMKQIMSAGILAFSDLSIEKKSEYVSRSQIGEIALPSEKYVLLNAKEQAALAEFRKRSGPDAGVKQGDSESLEAAAVRITLDELGSSQSGRPKSARGKIG